MRVKLSDIIKDHNTQCRASIDTEVVNDYAERMSEGDVFPPVVLIKTEKGYFIGDGWHRVRAAEQVGYRDIEADITEGTREDAIKYALKANVANGLRRTSKDKRRCVEVALNEFAELTNRAIAELCGVGDQLVLTLRPAVQLRESRNTPEPEKRTGADGKQYNAHKPPRTTPAPSTKQTAVEREEAEYLQKETVTEKTETKVETTTSQTDKHKLARPIPSPVKAALNRLETEIRILAASGWKRCDKDELVNAIKAIIRGIQQ